MVVECFYGLGPILKVKSEARLNLCLDPIENYSPVINSSSEEMVNVVSSHQKCLN